MSKVATIVFTVSTAVATAQFPECAGPFLFTEPPDAFWGELVTRIQTRGGFPDEFEARTVGIFPSRGEITVFTCNEAGTAFESSELVVDREKRLRKFWVRGENGERIRLKIRRDRSGNWQMRWSSKRRRVQSQLLGPDRKQKLTTRGELEPSYDYQPPEIPN